MNAELPVAAAETHVGAVFFLGDRAYKIKKPVRTAFLDFTGREAREAVCHREVELNRRFSPDVYLGVADLLGPDGELCDHLVVMRRMDPALRLSRLVGAGAPVQGPLREVARRLASWHSIAPRGAEISAQGTRDALLARWSASFEQTRAHRLHGATEIERLTRRFLAGRSALFDRRVQAGRIVDGHGDLIADDVFCLPDGPRILDCLEFDDRLRYVDGLDDAAFLAMDLERLRAPDLARRFLDTYAEFSGDPAPASLRHHYVAYRAFVRAKVASLRTAQGDRDSSGLIRVFSDIALQHLRAGAVTLTLVGGLPGTGKSTLAAALADRLGWTVLSSDRLRKEIAGVSPEKAEPVPYGEGIYSPELTEKTYETMLERAERLLRLGESVILDASWTDADLRRTADDLASRTDSDLVSLRCQAPAEITAERMRARITGPSDADERIAAAMAASADPWPEAIEIGTAWGVEPALARALTAVRPHGHEHLWPVLPQMEAD